MIAKNPRTRRANHSRASKKVDAYRPDAVDLALLALLRDEGRLSLADAARRLQRKEPTLHGRLRRLRQAGYIGGFHAEVDYGRLGLPITAYVGVKLQHAWSRREQLVQELMQLPEVVQMQ